MAAAGDAPFLKVYFKNLLYRACEIRNRLRISRKYGFGFLKYTLCPNEVGLPIGTHGINGYSFGTGGINELSIAQENPHMVDDFIAIQGEEDQVPGLEVAVRNGRTHLVLIPGHPG